MIAAPALLGWFARAERDLPWREPDVGAWPILMSEVMLQQTPVARVLPVWQEWVRRWPTPAALAAEPVGTAVRAWGKLGYPRRALRLHACAQALVAQHGGVVPADVDTLLTLPGIGEYTARAVACFAFGQNVPVVDINVRRVIARAVHGKATATTPKASDLDDARSLLTAPRGPRPAQGPRYSAALMELGALICTAREPQCAVCPVHADCAWHAAGQPAATGPKPKAQKFAGTDRQVRGLLLDVLRGSPTAVPKPRLDIVWPDITQRERALYSLLDDGLIELTSDGLFALAGEA